MASEKPYGKLPQNASPGITPFTLEFPEADVKHMRELLKLSRVAEPLYENSLPNGDRHLGLRRDWLLEAKRVWETDFDWRKTEARINSFPNFKVTLDDKLGKFDIHFAALFSTRPDAVPVVMMHGWPGSFLEFLPLLELAGEKYTPETLKYHFIIPSLPGYTLSSPQNVKHDFSQADAARIIDSLMQHLGFADGYVAQGGDVGSRVGRIMAAQYESCKAAKTPQSPDGYEVNFCSIPDPGNVDESQLSQVERDGLVRWNEWKATGTAYAMEQGTKPSTIGFVLSSNPLALLAWIGEKYLDWTDDEPSINTILESVTLYWLSKCTHSNIWSYRHSYGPNAKGHEHPDYHIKVPLGYSYYPRELIPIPIAWVKTTGNLVWSRIHDKGGHFAALERPREMLEDVEDFVGKVWKR